jgi:hypothetical protein
LCYSFLLLWLFLHFLFLSSFECHIIIILNVSYVKNRKLTPQIFKQRLNMKWNLKSDIFTFQCLLDMLNHAPFLYTTELESLATLCFRAFDGSNYEVRCAVAKLLGTLVAATQQTQKGNPAGR